MQTNINCYCYEYSRALVLDQELPIAVHLICSSEPMKSSNYHYRLIIWIQQFLFMEQITFPTKLEKFSTVLNKEELAILINSELKLFSQEYNALKMSYKIRTLKKQKYLSARCQKCTANLNFKLDEDTNRYFLTKSNCTHRHASAGRPNLQEIKQYLSKIETNDLFAFRKMIKKRFHISDSTFYKAKREVQSGRQVSFPELVDSLLAENISLKYDPCPLSAIGDFPQTFIVITPQMKRLYQQFGKCIFIDFTFNCIRDKPNFEHDKKIAIFNQQRHREVKKRSRQFIIGILTGLSNAHKIVVFAYCFVLSESAENVYTFLRSFFDSQMQNITETIISDGGIGINSAIKRLEEVGSFKGYHLRDCYHILKSIKLKHSEDWKKLSELYKARTIEEYHEIYSELESTLVQEQEISELKKVDELSSLFCFSKIPATFVHFGSSSSACEKTNDLIKQRIKYAEPYCQVALKLIKIFASINARCMEATRQKINFEDALGIKQLKQCRECLPKPVFRQILNQFSKSIPLRVLYDNSQSNSEQHVVKSHKSGHQYRVSIRNQKLLTCSCSYPIKTGLLCRHAICYLNSRNLPYFYYINEFYKSAYAFKQPQQKEREILQNKQ